LDLAGLDIRHAHDIMHFVLLTVIPWDGTGKEGSINKLGPHTWEAR